MNPELLTIAGQFAGGSVITLSPLGNGLINDTYCVTADSGRFVLQRLNSNVFAYPERVMANLQLLGRHIRQKPTDAVQLRIPSLLTTLAGKAFLNDDDGHCWRAMQLINPGESRERISRNGEAENLGFALGHFHRLCSDLPTETLHDTLPGFHITPAYFAQYQLQISQPLQIQGDDRIAYCQRFIEGFLDHSDTLEQAKHQGLLIERVIHGDPKLNNFLFEPGSDRIVSLIDLDTVKPGLVHYDIGDCLRSACHILENNRFDLERCAIILTSYLREAGHFFSPADYAYLYPAILLIPFELGLRFFSDYLAGNCYFKVGDEDENLRRAVAQFQLCEDIDAKRGSIEKMISSLISY